ncbi:MAG: Histidine kinase [Verrucomicrobiales bacterium]|nr:Histidine kinase [Verrucomicrobiales bacterium]
MRPGLALSLRDLLRRGRDMSVFLFDFRTTPFLAVLFLLAMASPALAEPGWIVRGFRTGEGLKMNGVASLSLNPKREIGIRYTFDDTLSIYDGYQFQHFPPLENAPGSDTFRVHKSRAAGQLWTIYPDGIKVFTDGKWDGFVIEDIQSLLLKNRTLTLLPAEQNRALCLLPDKLIECVRKFDPETKEWRAQVTILKSAVEFGIGRLLSMTLARDGGLFIAGSEGVARLEGPFKNMGKESVISRFAAPNGLEITERQRPIEDSYHGFTMVGIDRSEEEKKIIVYFDGEDFWNVDPMDSSIHFAWRDVGNKFFVVTLSSLFSVENGRKTGWEEPPRASYYDVVVEEDRVFWLATSDGMFRFSPQIWQPYPNPIPDLSGALAMAETEDKGLVVTTSKAIYLWQTNSWEKMEYRGDFQVGQSLPDQLFAFPTNRLVFGYGQRLYQLDVKNKSIDEITEPNGNMIKPLGRTPTGGLYVQRFNKELKYGFIELGLYDGTGFQSLPEQQGKAPAVGDVRFLFHSSSDEIWLGGSEGLAWFHNNAWGKAGSRGTEQRDPITGCMEAEPGVMWFGFRDKVLSFNVAKMNWTEVKTGFDGVAALMKDRTGRLWVATGNGLWSNYKDIWSWNGTEEGLASPAIQVIYQGKGGTLLAGTTRGLSFYSPRADMDAPRVLPVALDKATVAEGSVRLNFTAEDRWFVTPRSGLLFSTRKDDGEWGPFTSEGTIVYSDLSGGKHTFQVRAMDRNWNLSIPEEADFTIVPPWNKDPRLLSIVIIGGLLISFLAALAINRHWRLVRSYAEVEKIVRLRTQQLEKANQELLHSQKMNALGTLAAGIAHDFNNILSIIKGSAQIIEKNPTDREKIQTRVDRIKLVSDQGAGIVKAMLGFSRISDKVMALQDINMVVEETIVLLGDRFQKDVNIEFEWAPGLPKVLIAKDFVQQMLLNLIFNSADAMGGRGQIVLRTGETKSLPGPMILQPAAAGEHIFISVMDFGMGIEPENMARIFEPFFTTKAFSARRGTGLGLSMVYELAREMQCGLHVESIVGKGSTFSLYVAVPRTGA